MELYFSIIMRTIFLYLIVVFIFRVMGKREIGELSILDLIVFFMIAEMAVVAIEDHNDPLIHSVIPMILLSIIQIILSFISLKSRKFRQFIDGRATIIINRGKIDEHAMRKERYNFDDLITQLRDKNINNIHDVEFAILEASGRLSVIEKEKNKENQPGLQFPLIIDGEVQTENLQKIEKTGEWLRKELKNHGINDITSISLCTFGKDEFFIDKKDED
ncbi:DUF421 domain-containing protein [Metabacillus fastidiosus]|uniref:DUF421 domain-containing protein n=1 Tax=Metabacillus fastidiosus TaxID=1458 RepID=A0ABU6NXE7_9BACI|nr:DUF421 domain-containing protein [Metabacillus fastidiosus]MED4401057.1 DUF421 domain-containing protein [Metabacillus fastidiosus]MED4453366.1 DUF421 domain-containing protein [Metabacillus fastidiosus]MED4463984.1 DUF421 domain-containing protein [Metabacillus fastidiosus]